MSETSVLCLCAGRLFCVIMHVCVYITFAALRYLRLHLMFGVYFFFHAIFPFHDMCVCVEQKCSPSSETWEWPRSTARRCYLASKYSEWQRRKNITNRCTGLFVGQALFHGPALTYNHRSDWITTRLTSHYFHYLPPSPPTHAPTQGSAVCRLVSCSFSLSQKFKFLAEAVRYRGTSQSEPHPPSSGSVLQQLSKTSAVLTIQARTLGGWFRPVFDLNR